MSAPLQTTAGSKTVTTTMDPNEELVNNIDSLFKTINIDDRQHAAALGAARRVYTQWLTKAKAREPITLARSQSTTKINASEQELKVLNDIKDNLKKAGGDSRASRVKTAIEEINEDLKDLDKLQNPPPVHSEAQASAGANRQETLGRQEFRYNEYGDETRVKEGHEIAEGYTGPFMNNYSVHEHNKVTGKARVLNGDSYGGKSVFDD